jgi:hypothetical protein
MKRLQRFVEQHRSGHGAYAFSEVNLPSPGAGLNGGQTGILALPNGC